MPEHIAHFAPGSDVTFTAGAAITGGQLVYISGNRTVSPTAAATEAWIGVATTDAAAGDKVATTSGGVHQLAASGAIPAGGAVVSAAAGAVADAGAAPVAGTVVGVALSAAAGGVVLVKLAR